MSNLTTFHFNDITVRTQVTDDGEPLFCLADVCNVLELSNPSMVASQIKDEFETPKLNLGVIQRETGPVEAVFITEPQLYFVLMRSRSDKAKPFRQWVVNDVLPSIRKTGKYEVQTKEPSLAVQFELAKMMLEPAGITGNQLALALDNLYKSEVGKSLLAKTNTQLVAPQQKQLLNPTEIGKPLGLSAIKVNKKLEEMGLQYKTEAGWQPTDFGLKRGAVLLDTGKRHSNGTPVRQLKWPCDIL